MLRGNEELGVFIPEILMPAENVDLTSWSVVACDQYTSQPDYWESVKRLVGDKPSTLNMIFPEVYLKDDNPQQRINQIKKTMGKYLSDNVLVPLNPCFIYVDRQTSRSISRKGLIIAVDLEKYDYSAGSQALIRATEGTVIERLPPRIKIRENATVELPHIMLLIDDEDKTVIEPLAQKSEKLEKLYDFNLMMEGMHIKGYKVDSQEDVAGVLNALEKLANPDRFRNKYGVGPDKGVLLFAVGDGNHSLAAAKGHWENVKKALTNEEISVHPARFALVEIVNVHDDGLKFEPIHRMVFNTALDKLLDEMALYYDNFGFHHQQFDSKELINSKVSEIRRNKGSHVIAYNCAGRFGIIKVENPVSNLEVGTLQAFLDEYAGKYKDTVIDYIHGEEVVDSLCTREDAVGFYLPSMDKCDLFKTVILDGVLPRKTFSMGEAEEKRFYMECRKIIK